MIPLRIQLAGFLCYREPQEACFDGRTLWMLAGPNGSGKSALFDAVTFALFGQHRGGKHNSRGLIHHDCDRMVIEFDFTLDEQHFRARRTLSRQGRSTRQILTRSPDEQLKTESWKAVPATHTERGFAQWIDTHIALTYETFTASVLLLQGQADNLLLATPAQRHRLLCHVVGLDRIERLAEQAQHYLSQTEGAAKACRQQTQQLAPGKEVQLRDLQQNLVAEEQQLAHQAAQIDHITTTLQQARHWRELTGELTKLQTEIDRQAEQLQQLQHHHSQQQRDAKLITHLPALRQLLDSTMRIARSRVEIQQLESSQQAVQIQLQQLDTTLHNLESSIATARHKLTDTANQEKQLIEQHANQTLACSSATRFAHTRDRLQQKRSSQAALQTRLQEARQQQTALRQSDSSDQQLATAQQTTRYLADQLARHEVLADHLRQQLLRFQSVVSADERTCPYCQQPLDREHCVREEQRMKQDLRNLEATLEQTRHQSAAATQHERTVQGDCDRHRTQLDTLSHQLQRTAAELQAAQMVEQELTEQCQNAYDEMPGDTQARLGANTPTDWIAMAFPNTSDLSDLQQQVRDTAGALQQLARECRTLQNTLEQSSSRQRTAVAQRNTAANTSDQCREQLAQQRGALSGLLELQQSARSTLPHQWHDLTPDHLPDLIQSLEAQSQQDLLPADCHSDADTQRIEQQQHALQARHALLTEESNKIPSAARCDSGPLQSQLNEAQHLLQQSETNRTKLQSELLQAEQRAKSYQTALDRLHTTQQQCRLWKRLAKLLGRDGLQRALLESSERAIVQYANTILDRLSGGQLYVELAQPTTSRSRSAKILDLVARTTGSHAHLQDVAFLSGSQKFRVAVALSLAIGQFASNTRRPVQAVIIDEGFGCLDATNRHVMIQELQNLRGHLQRILLVSHQDEFVSAFTDGYRCELIDGATQLTPFHA